MPSPQIEDEIVERWLAGEKADDIALSVGVSRSTVFSVVRNRGMTTSKGPRARPEVHGDQILERYEAAQREIGKLQLRIEQLENELHVRTLEQREAERQLRDKKRDGT
jgi:hypothetical protein